MFFPSPQVLLDLLPLCTHPTLSSFSNKQTKNTNTTTKDDIYFKKEITL